MFKTGVQFKAGVLQIQPEFAITLPIAGTSTLTDEQRARFGDRAGAESNQPGVQGRIVFSSRCTTGKESCPRSLSSAARTRRSTTSFPARRSPPRLRRGRPGSQHLRARGHRVRSPVAHGRMLDPRLLPAGNSEFLPAECLDHRNPAADALGHVGGQFTRATTCASSSAANSTTSSPTSTAPPKLERAPLSAAEPSCWLPRRLPVQAPPSTATATRLTFPSSNPLADWAAFAEMSFPLSRIFHANLEGYNSGWVLHLTYSTDRANAADVRHGNGLARTDLDTGSITYKLNKWVTFVDRSQLHQHSAATAHSKLFAGQLVTQAHNWRNEFGPVFVFLVRAKFDFENSLRGGHFSAPQAVVFRVEMGPSARFGSGHRFSDAVRSLSQRSL